MARTLEAETGIVKKGPVVLDDHVMLLLTAIEGETAPDRLLELATALQSALAEQKQKRTPN